MADFACNAMIYRSPFDFLGGIGGLDLEQLGLSDETGYDLKSYCVRTGHKGVVGCDHFPVLKMFRFAAMLHRIRA
jgi:hypothetical protein